MLYVVKTNSILKDRRVNLYERKNNFISYTFVSYFVEILLKILVVYHITVFCKLH